MAKKRNVSNDEIAGVLDQIADLLEAQGENIHRIRSYRGGANSVRSAEQPVADLVRLGDRAGLKALPGIGEGLASVIFDYVEDGRSEVLDRLRAEVSPAQVLSQVPGIGDDLARRIIEELQINSLEELEQAAHDGRLDQVEGFGERRVEQVRTSLAGMLSGAARRHAARAAADSLKEEKDSARIAVTGSRSASELAPEVSTADQPPVSLLLDVDTEYRRRAVAGDLPTIAPKRFNPKNESWLPILRTERGEWKFSAMFSNTALAHDLGKTHDWVVIYFDRGQGEDQITVVTENNGPLAGRRVVRGREMETRRHYENSG